MKYIIMCGGEYDKFETPKQLSVINDETIDIDYPYQIEELKNKIEL